MTVVALLSRLRKQEIRVWVDQGQLRYSAPPNALTPELRAELIAQKAEIITFLQTMPRQQATAPIMPRTTHDQHVPLSYAQQRLWFLDQLVPGNPFYNLHIATRLRGRLDVAALEKSVRAIVERHEILRTVFVMLDGQPLQEIRSEVQVTLHVIDLSVLPAAERDATARRLGRDVAQQPFDLQRGPLLRCNLLRFSDDEYVGLFTMHHIVSDDWSLAVLVREAAALYSAFTAEQPAPLAPLPLQYADYALWQRQSLAGARLDTLLRYWQNQLADLATLQLPTDRPRTHTQSMSGARQTLSLSAALTGSLKDLSQRHGTTLFMTLLAAFQTLLHRYSGQNDIVVGTPIAGRSHSTIEQLIGCFINMLVLRTDLGANPTFEILLRRVRDVCLSAYAHGDLPFEQVVEALQPERDLSRSPLFQVMFVLQNAPAEAIQLPGVTFEPIAVEHETARFDLTLSMVEAETGLQALAEYQVDLFDSSTIARMLEHFRVLLEAVVADPGRRLSDLPLLNEEEHQQFARWNATAAALPQDVSIPDLFAAQAARTPHAPAVIWQDQQLTYGELDQHANQLARHLQTLGVGPDVVVGVCLERSLDLVIALLGILKAGGAYVPLDPAYPAERLNHMLEDSQARVVLGQQHLPAGSLGSHTQTIALDQLGATLPRYSVKQPHRRISPDNLAYVIYTSGSTGRPKGVMVSHRQVINLFTGIDAIVQPDPPGVWLAVTGISFDIAVLELFWTLVRGFKVVLQAEDMRGSGAAAAPQSTAYSLAAQLRRHQVSHLQCTPALARMLLTDAETAQALSGVKHLLLGGEALPAALVEQLRVATNARLYNMYGPTETTVWSAACPLSSVEGVVPIGRPIANTHIYLLDRYLQHVPVGVPGELYIGGAGVVRGYLGRPDLTAERFIPDPFAQGPGARLYRTGDLARYLPDGQIEFLGRLDHQVKLRGYRIELGEIEATLAQHPAVDAVVVTAREMASGEPMLVAYVEQRTKEQRPEGTKNQEPRTKNQELSEDVLSPSPAAGTLWVEAEARRGSGQGDKGGEGLSSTLRQWLGAGLPAYMIPTHIMVLDALPLTPNGKVDRRALPDPDHTRPDLASEFVAPATPVERDVAAIWSDVLGVERVGIHDNFFDLGGHSLLVVQVMSRIRTLFQVEIPLRFMFETPTVAGLVVEIAQKQAELIDQDELALLLAELEEIATDEGV
ncbi:MAG TPA: amino acid adenylation domain-containing protein [Herpetosiphonaceae bacterium]